MAARSPSAAALDHRARRRATRRSRIRRVMPAAAGLRHAVRCPGAGAVRAAACRGQSRWRRDPLFGPDRQVSRSGGRGPEPGSSSPWRAAGCALTCAPPCARRSRPGAASSARSCGRKRRRTRPDRHPDDRADGPERGRGAAVPGAVRRPGRHAQPRRGPGPPARGRRGRGLAARTRAARYPRTSAVAGRGIRNGAGRAEIEQRGAGLGQRGVAVDQ